MTLHRNLIAGEWAAAGQAKNNINPSDISDVVGEYSHSDTGQAEAAIAAAKAAAPGSPTTTTLIFKFIYLIVIERWIIQISGFPIPNWTIKFYELNQKIISSRPGR